MIRVGATSHCTPGWTICMLSVYTDRPSSNSLLIHIQRVLNRLVCRCEAKMFWPMELWSELVLLVYTLGDVTVQCVFMDKIIAYRLCTLIHFLALDSKAKICVYFVGLAYQGKDIVF